MLGAIAITLTDQQRKWGKRLGYPLFGLIAFVYGLHLTFPYERLEERLRDAAGDGFDVRVASAGPGWFPGDVVLEGITLTTRPQREDEKPVSFTIDRLDLDLAIVSIMTGTVGAQFEAQVGEGVIEGEYSGNKSRAELHVSSSNLPMETIPGVRTVTGGVPMTGGLSMAIDITLPKGKWKEASGKIELACEGCTIGDGVSKIRPSGPGQVNAFSQGGFTLPKLKLGKVGGKLVVQKGLGKFQDFQAKSADGELYLDGEIRFEDPFVSSQITAYMRFKASDKLMEREPKFEDIIAFMKGPALRADGYYGMRITGPLKGMRFLGSKTSPVPTGKDGKDSGGGKPGVAAGGMGGMNAIPVPGPDGPPPTQPQVQLPPGVGSTPPPDPGLPAAGEMPPPPPAEMPPPPPVETPPPPPPAPPPTETNAPATNPPPAELRMLPRDSDLGNRPSDAPPPPPDSAQPAPQGEPPRQEPPPPY